MICKERSIDVISIGGGGGGSGGSGQQPMGNTTAHGHCNTLQNRRKSQLITFSSSSCDIKNSLSHEIILVNNSQYTNSNNNNNNHKTTDLGSFGGGRSSITGSSNNTNVRLSYAEEDILIVTNGVGSVSGSGSGSGSASASGSAGSAGSGHDADLEDDVFRRRSLEVDDDVEVDFDDDEEFGTHIETSNNANDDSGGGSYEDSHALQSSIGGSNRNSLEKDDDDIDVDVISTDVSCYDQLLGSSCNTRNDDDIATIVGDGENYTKLCKNGSITGMNGSGGGGGGENCGIIYANPFMDDEGIAESGM